MTIDDYFESLTTALRQYVEAFRKSGEEFVRDGLAEPLDVEVLRAIKEATGADHWDLLRVLGKLDKDLEELRRLARHTEPAPGHYENWTRYWITASPQIGVVRQLVREILTPQLARVRSRLVEFRTSKQVYRYVTPRKLRFRVEGPAFTMPERQGRFRSLMRTVVRLICLGFRKAEFVGSLGGEAFASMLQREEVHSVVQSGSKRTIRKLIPLEVDFAREFSQFAAKDPIMEAADVIATEHVPNAVFSGIARHFANAVEERIRALYRTSFPAVEARVSCISNGWISLSRRMPPALIAAVSTAVASVLAYRSTGLGSGWTSGPTAWVLIGLLMAKMSSLMLRTELANALIRTGGQQLSDAAIQWAHQVADQVDDDMMASVVANVGVQLSPRPLQRALRGELE
ncbi:hypothetical protein FCG40_05455 [Fimbriimonadia bacterium ATM]|nr:MAG: hypothetical protein EDM73_07580 [Armatimonadota bacterium]MBC6969965.1 hypothetical protein [Armatimonadota bacterium]MCE7900261.1 hypothetical protein [Armatimonadetes bacterium ATM1]MDL1928417.1 hypothetical protein [Fimbriimonadia bacterium ATM]RIJ96652.1 MAG: hypothetical protein DCC45_06390 [Armatimonadota bacterium]